MQIMDHVDILDLIEIQVFRPNIYEVGAFEVSIEALDRTKNVVIDEDELKTLGPIITEKCREFKDAREQKVAEYIKEFVGRMCSEWHRVGLLVLDEVKEGHDDPYKTAKDMFKNVR